MRRALLLCGLLLAVAAGARAAVPSIFANHKSKAEARAAFDAVDESLRLKVRAEVRGLFRKRCMRIPRTRARRHVRQLGGACGGLKAPVLLAAWHVSSMLPNQLQPRVLRLLQSAGKLRAVWAEWKKKFDIAYTTQEEVGAGTGCAQTCERVSQVLAALPGRRQDPHCRAQAAAVQPALQAACSCAQHQAPARKHVAVPQESARLHPPAPTHAQDDRRFQIFKSNLKDVIATNKDDSVSHWAGINRFSAWTHVRAWTAGAAGAARTHAGGGGGWHTKTCFSLSTVAAALVQPQSGPLFCTLRRTTNPSSSSLYRRPSSARRC